MTTPKPPTRAEALAEIIREWERDREGLKVRPDTKNEWIKRQADKFTALSATDATIVEGKHRLDAQIYQRRDEWVLELSGVINECNFTCRHTEPLSTALENVAGLPSLYAQGRTQSVPDGWIRVDPDNIYYGYFAWLDDESDDQEPIVCVWPPMDKNTKCFQRGYYFPIPPLSAAPPVTGGAWLPIETAPMTGKVIRLAFDDNGEWMTCDGMYQAGAWVIAATFYDERRKPPYTFREHRSNKVPVFWQPLPAPPSSAEKEGV